MRRVQALELAAQAKSLKEWARLCEQRDPHQSHGCCSLGILRMHVLHLAQFYASGAS